jgi:TPR repeat protein
LIKHHRHKTMIPACGLALLVLIVIANGIFRPALAGSNEALVDAVTGAFTPAQISQLIASTGANTGSRTDREAQSIQRLQQLLGVSSDVVLALLRILDRPDIQPADVTQVLAQSAIQYHAVTDRLTEIAADDPDGQRMVTQAQAAMTAGHFSDTEILLRQLEDREVAFSGDPSNGIAPPASSAALHLISAAQAGTVLGEIALMKLRYGDATNYFQAAEQRLARLPKAELIPVEAQPAGIALAMPADAQPSAETKSPPPQPAAVSSRQAGTEPPAPIIDPDAPEAPREPRSAAVGSGNAAATQLAAVATAAPRSLPKQPAGLPSAGTVPSADMVALLLRRGDALFALGDVSSARLLYQRAAEGGDGRGATGVAKTYDPMSLRAIGARGIQADPVAAATWYRRAIELGDQSAADRLTQMSQRSSR